MTRGSPRDGLASSVQQLHRVNSIEE